MFGKPPSGCVVYDNFDSMEREDGVQQPLPSEQVMSEVHLGCPPNHSGPHLSHFTISLPPRYGKPNCPILS